MNTLKCKLLIIGICWACILPLASCTSPASVQNTEMPSLETPQVTVRVVTPGPEPTQVECSAQANDVNILIEITSSNVEVMVTGLEPGENIVLMYERNLPQHTSTLVSQPSVLIGEDGKFEESWSLGNFKPEQGVMANEWLVKVIHAQGVTCATFEVPAE